MSNLTKFNQLSIKQIEQRVGTLSHPSKMPGPAWGIPASFCKTGNVLAKVPGTPCSVCYARKGRYVFPNVYEAQVRRLNGWENDPEWAELIASRILRIKGFVWFRWFDSGDLQSRKMLEDINKVAFYTKDKAKHWIATQERQFVRAFDPEPNLIIRVSSTKLEEIQQGWPYMSAISKTNVTCPSKQQDNKCGECRKCWEEPLVIYQQH